MHDQVERIGKGTLIQHGKYNDRIYLMKLHRDDCPEILGELRGMARENGYSKIFTKVPASAAPLFLADGYIMEAHIPGFYKGKEAVFFLSKYLDSDRLMGVEYASLKELATLLGEKAEKSPKSSTPAKASGKFKWRKLNEADVEDITRIYLEVFLSYPFPIHNPGYILKTMKEDVRYYGLEKKGKLAAVASADVDRKGSNAEMTDFATLPGFRGKGLSVRLLIEMEKQIKKEGIRTLFTIARLNSPAMNRTFLRLNYTYSGTLIRNTHIAGRLESMNVYYKRLKQ